MNRIHNIKQALLEPKSEARDAYIQLQYALMRHEKNKVVYLWSRKNG